MMAPKDSTHTTPASPSPVCLSGNARPSMIDYYDRSPESPDGRFVVWTEFAGAVPGPAEVVLYDRATGETDRIGETLLGNPHQGVQGRWLDGERFLYACHGAGKARCRIVHVADRRCETLPGAPEDASAANGLGIYSHTLLRHFGEDRDEACIYTVDLRTGEERTLITRDAALALHPDPRARAMRDRMEFTHAKWAPDGRLAFVILTNVIAWKRDRSLPLIKSLMLVRPDGSGLRYFNQGQCHPTWMPDGSGIYQYEVTAAGVPFVEDPPGNLAGCPAGGTDSMALRRLSGAAPEVLHRGPGNHGSLRPGGGWIVTDAFGHPAPDRNSVLLYPVGGRKPRPLLEMPRIDVNHATGMHPHPAWSADGRRIYFNGWNAGGIRQVYCVDAGELGRSA